MSITKVRRIPCRRCGREIEAVTIESANVMRHPHFQEQLLDRRLLKMSCPRCGAVHLHFDRFMWTDLPGRLCAIVMDDNDRPDWPRLESETREAIAIPFSEGPPVVRELGRALTIRLAFGLEELREKVLCRIHGLDDRLVEALKLELPFGSTVEGVGADGSLRFDDQGREFTVDAQRLTQNTSRRAELPGIFDPRAAWVSVLRAHRAPAHYMNASSGGRFG